VLRPASRPADLVHENFITVSIGIKMTGNLPHLLGGSLVYRPRLRVPRNACVVAWGLKRSAEAAARYAERHGLELVTLEDGFIRSVGLGDRDPPLSMVWDDTGIYYDATRPSRLERLIATPIGADAAQRAARLALRWREARVSKYNHGSGRAAPLPEDFVLAVDQTFGDSSITHGLADAKSFQRMLEAALDEHPRSRVILKVHPDVLAGRKRAHFETLAPGVAERVTLLADNLHPPHLLQNARAVYVVTSQMGFEALLWDKPVRCFGMPFYAGWGLTADELASPARRRGGTPVDRERLVHAALIDYPRYLDPETLERCEAERLVDWMGVQRAARDRAPAAIQAIGFSEWKQPIARAFFAGSTVRFAEEPEALAPGEERAVWGRRMADDLQRARPDAPPPLCVEDGFLRSVGLGAERAQPLSWVIDRRGMYYDAGTPSDLETLLQHGRFAPALLARAAALRERIVEAGLTKYNVGRGDWRRPVGGRPVVLVPGQVESDASIAFGAAPHASNLGLVEAVRRLRPEAHVVYKPHPDVVAGKRGAGAGEEQVRRHCDEVVVDVPIHRLLMEADEVHVLTSLAGFEALLRGRRVTCHGQPFYAGWGLTEDLRPHPRRSRRLSLDELVAGALILYPLYVSRVTGAFTTPERALHELLHWHELAPPEDSAPIRLLRRAKALRDRWRRR
jgi:capsular polysaccharide export protein